MPIKSEISPHKLKAVEEIRKRNKRRIKINVIHFFAIIAVAVVAIVLLQNNDNKLLPPLVFLFLAANFFYTIYVYFNVHKTYEIAFNEGVLDDVIPKEIEGVDFIPVVVEEDIREIWHKSQPFKSEPLGYIPKSKAKKRSIGYRGVYQGLDFEFYDVATYKNGSTYTSGRKSSSTDRQFVGFLMRVKRASKLDTPVYIVDKNNTLHNPFNEAIKNVIYSGYKKLTPPNKIDTGEAAFEEKLAVYSESEEVAKELVTTDLATQLLKSFKEIDYPWYNITFTDDQVYGIMFAPLGLFHLDLDKSVSDKETLDGFVELFKQKINFLRVLSK